MVKSHLADLGGGGQLTSDLCTSCFSQLAYAFQCSFPALGSPSKLLFSLQGPSSNDFAIEYPALPSLSQRSASSL